MFNSGRKLQFALLGVSLLTLSYTCMGQCRVVVRSVKIASDGGSVVLEYYNPGTRPVKSVQLELRTVDASSKTKTASIHFGVAGQMPPGHSRTVVFNAENGKSLFAQEASEVESLEVEVTGVTFLDRSTWTPPQGTVCKATFHQR